MAGRLIARSPQGQEPSPAFLSNTARARLDLVGLILAIALIGWTYLVAGSLGGSAGPFAALVLASTAALVIGRLTASVHRWLVPAVVIAVAAVEAMSTPDVLSSAPLSQPFGYSNAKGAFFVQASIAGLMLVATVPGFPLKVLGLVAAIAFGVVPFAVESLTAAGLVLLPILVLGIFTTARGRVAVVSCGVLFIVVLSITIILGSTYSGRDRSNLVDRIVDSTLSERRAALWNEALVMMRENPIAGVGVGGFQVLSPTARLDRDARWAHNSFLQQGAETGLMGLILLLLLFVWGFVSLWAPRTPDALGILGAVALAALGIHASVDYVLHFPPVPLTAAILVGAAGATSARSHAYRGTQSLIPRFRRNGRSAEESKRRIG